MQGVVLAHLLDLSPAHLSVDELLRELADDPTDPGERDQIHRAIRDLAHAGLVHRYDGFVFPTRAAVQHHALTRH